MKFPAPDSVPNTYQVVPGPEMGMVTPEVLENIASIAREHDIPLIKITSAQRLAFVGMDPAEQEIVNAKLGIPNIKPTKGNGLTYIQACPGKGYCKYGRQHSFALGKRLQEELVDIILPAKTKVGVSGCPMNCCESYIRDLGIFGKKKGWTLIFGGNGGGNPRIGDVIAKHLNDNEVLGLARRVLEFYASKARNLERSARFMEHTSLTELKEAVLNPKSI